MAEDTPPPSSSVPDMHSDMNPDLDHDSDPDTDPDLDPQIDLGIDPNTEPDNVLLFARGLYRDDPDLFESPYKIINTIEMADRDIRKRNQGMPSLLQPCAQREGDDSRCWALSKAEELNTIFNPFGVEFIELHEGALDFRTIFKRSTMTEGPDDNLLFLLTLWLLREHHCIAGIRLNVSVVARFHPLLFMKNLEINKNVVTVDFIGLDGLMYPFQVCPLVLALDGTERLTHVTLDQMTLADADSLYLSSLITTNQNLESLALRNVSMTVLVLAKLVRRMQEYRRPRDFELQGKFLDPIRRRDLISRLAATSFRTLRLEVFGNLTQLFQRLGDNRRLYELELGRWSTAVASLDILASALAANTTLRRLTLSLDMKWLRSTSEAWNHLGSVVKNSRSLQSVRLRNSRLGSSAVIALSEAIEKNETLRTLDLECCEFSFTDALAFVRALSQNSTLSEVRLGALSGDDDQQHWLFNQLLVNNLCSRVSCVFTEVQAEVVSVALQKGTAFHELNLRSPRVRRFEALFDGLMHVTSCLTTLSLTDLGSINHTAAMSLSWFLRYSTVLRKVELGMMANAGVCLLILQGLSRSTSVRSLKVDRWCLEEATAKAFERFLRSNSSVTKITIIQENEDLECVLTECIKRGLMENYSVSKLRVQSFHGNLELHDFSLWRSVQINRIVASWAGDFVTGKKVTRGVMFAFKQIMKCDARDDIIYKATGFEKDELEVMITGAIRTAEDELLTLACLFKEAPQGDRQGPWPAQFRNFINDIRAEIRRYLNRIRSPLSSLTCIM